MKQIKAMLIMTSAYYGMRLEDQIIDMYAKDLADLGAEGVSRALTEIRRDPKITRMPLPAMIRYRLTPAVTPENEAIEAVSRMIQAVSRIGPYQTTQARQFIGEIGWAVVLSEGGWEQVCENLTDENVGVMRAQWKGIALSKIAMSKAGRLEAPALPGLSLKQIGFTKLLQEMPRGTEGKDSANVEPGNEGSAEN